jgi:hypothetical protein
LVGSDIGGIDLAAEYRISLSKKLQLLICELSDAANSKSGTREWLSLCESCRQAKLSTESAHLILSQSTKRLNKSFEVHSIG